MTYLHYIDNLRLYLVSKYGNDAQERYGHVYRDASLASKAIHRRPLTDALRKRLEQHYRGALSNLVCLRLEVVSEEFFPAKNAWTPAQAWYTLHHALGALGTYVSPQRTPDHKQSCRDAAQLVADRGVLPYPWSLHVRTSHAKSLTTTRFEFHGEPTPLSSNLAAPALDTFEDRFAVMLDTTAKRRAERTFAEERRKKKYRGRLSATVKDGICEAQGATTVFDVLYRLRIRANYGDVDTFVVGCASHDEARAFASALEVVTDCSLTVIEAVLDRYAQPGHRVAVLDSFASRNRVSNLVAHRKPPGN